MKKRVLHLLMLISLLFPTFSCSSNSGAVELPHFDASKTEKYDKDVFYRNDLTIFGGDSDVIYVPKERDPVYGGYFYQYTSGNFLSTRWLEDDHTYGFSCLRSKDMNDWEMCGAVDNGYALYVDAKEWVYGYLWAPEVEYDPITNRYYLFFSAKSYPIGAGHPEIDFDRTNFHFAICSSESPIGPFRLLSSEEYYSFPNKTPQYNDLGEVINLNGEVITPQKPPIDVAKHFGLDYPWGVIDLSPFVDYDENGNQTLYLYFAKHWTNEAWEAVDPEGRYRYDCLSIWCIKMKDWLTPDYDSLRMVAYPSMKSVEYNEGPIHLDSSYNLIPFEQGEDGYGEDDSKLNEGPQVLAHVSPDGKKRYYLTYSQTGYAARDYGCYQAVSDSPNGPFVKLGRARAALGVTNFNDYMTGVGHHAYVDIGDELYCVYWVHADPMDASTSGNNGRIYAFDKQTYIYDENLKFGILYGNGPTKSVQPLPYLVSGYRNIADQAKIVATNADNNTIKYLNDDKVVFLEYYEENEFKANGKTTITLTFDEPKDVRAISIYNSFDYYRAFSKIDNITFTLSEKPSWYNITDFSNKLVINNLEVNENYYNPDGFMRQGGSASASFNEIKVSKIEITISQSLAGQKEINVSDICILGK